MGIGRKKKLLGWVENFKLSISSLVISSSSASSLLSALLRIVICLSINLSGKVTLNAINKLPNSKGFLWKGRPLPSIVLRSSGLITSPGLFLILIFDPSRWVIEKSTPVSASANVIVFSMRRSAPFLLKRLCGYS